MEYENINVKTIYENIANNFSDKRGTNWDWIDSFINTINYNSSILDIGCGNGRNMKYPNYNFYGIDNCSKFVEMAKEVSKNVYLSDMTNLPFEDNYFDAIISIASFHHLSTTERRIECLKEMHRVLKPGGKILLSIWSINQSHNKKLNNQFTFGDNIVPFKNNKGDIIGNRYYYIFQLNEIYNLLTKDFKIDSHEWIHGNEVFILIK
uniref:Methyltransferase type 11 domain-containing protein n=1 Tax=viral metagenome TaxID=1070528 RepID=A0A6C0HVM2_9ZZZZ